MNPRLESVLYFDFTTRSSCPNFSIKEWKNEDNDNNEERKKNVNNNNGISIDPNGECFFALSSDSVLFSFDAKGNVPCRNASLPIVNQDVFIVKEGIRTVLDVLANDENVAPSTLEITIPPASAVDAVVEDGKIALTPVQTVDVFEYRVCSAGFGSATASAIAVVKICADQEDFDGDGVPNCFDHDEDQVHVVSHS